MPGIILKYSPKTISLLFLFVLMFISCKKDNYPEDANNSPSEKILDQLLILSDSLKISYKATITGVASATLNISRNNQSLFQIQIKDNKQAGPDYEKTFAFDNNYCRKGKYIFILLAENIVSRDTFEVPNYKPVLLAPLKPFDFNEGWSVNIELPQLSDKNPEDSMFVRYTKATSLDNKVKIVGFLYRNSVQEVFLSIAGLPDCFGTYQIEIEYGSINGGFEKTVLSGRIIPKMRINPFIQPNDSTLNWYGSGDINNDNLLNSQDLVRMTELLNGSLSNSSDKRLIDRSDVNGDGIVTIVDKQIIEDKIIGKIQYLPGEWNKLTNRTEREDWLKKMLAIDQTSEMIPPPGWVCAQYATQTLINFHGVCNRTDIKRILEETNYDFSNNGRFNIPMYFLAMVYPDIMGHAMNTVVVGNNILVWNDLCNLEPNNDDINVLYSLALNPTFYILGLPVLPKTGAQITWSDYCQYKVQNGIIIGEGNSTDENSFPPIKVIEVKP